MKANNGIKRRGTDMNGYELNDVVMALLKTMVAVKTEKLAVEWRNLNCKINFSELRYAEESATQRIVQEIGRDLCGRYDEIAGKALTYCIEKENGYKQGRLSDIILREKLDNMSRTQRTDLNDFVEDLSMRTTNIVKREEPVTIPDNAIIDTLIDVSIATQIESYSKEIIAKHPNFKNYSSAISAMEKVNNKIFGNPKHKYGEVELSGGYVGQIMNGEPSEQIQQSCVEMVARDTLKISKFQARDVLSRELEKMNDAELRGFKIMNFAMSEVSDAVTKRHDNLRKQKMAIHASERELVKDESELRVVQKKEELTLI